MLRNTINVTLLIFRSLGILWDPTRLDGVLEVGDRLATPKIIEPIRRALLNHPETAQALTERRRVGRRSLEELRNLPEGTFGRDLARYFDDNKLNPEDLPVRPASDDRSFILAHLYETHDYWHVATGFKTDVAGEMGLLAFYASQGPFMLSILLIALGLLNSLLFAREDYDRRMSSVVRGWTLGKKSKPLFGVSWTELLSRPLEDVRSSLRLEAA